MQHTLAETGQTENFCPNANLLQSRSNCVCDSNIKVLIGDSTPVLHVRRHQLAAVSVIRFRGQPVPDRVQLSSIVAIIAASARWRTERIVIVTAFVGKRPPPVRSAPSIRYSIVARWFILSICSNQEYTYDGRQYT